MLIYDGKIPISFYVYVDIMLVQSTFHVAFIVKMEPGVVFKVL